MEQLLETIQLDTDDSNELLFKIVVEGLEQAPVKTRLVCEADDVSYVFNGVLTTDDVVRFVLPALKLKEGTYPSYVEVLVAGRYFTPVEFVVELKKPVKVVAESIQVIKHRAEPQVRVTASPIVAKKVPTVPVPAVRKVDERASTPAKNVIPAPSKPKAPPTLAEIYGKRRG